MNALFKRPDIIPVSIGYSCHVKVFCDMLSELDGRFGTARQPFDWVGTPMWAINEIVAADFANLTDRMHIRPRRRFATSDVQYLTHDTYNVAYLHDYGKDPMNVPDAVWATATEAYNRRIDRWRTTLASGRPILFIRLEQDKKERISYPEFASHEEHDELYHVQRFAEYMKAKGIPYMVLFLSTTHPRAFDSDRRICTVQFAKKDPASIVGGDQLQTIVIANTAFIRDCLLCVPYYVPPVVVSTSSTSTSSSGIITV